MERNSMSTEIQTIGNAILVRDAIRYAAYIAITWIAFSYLDGWVMTYLSK